VERILFAATKADHLHHTQHPALTAITTALLAEAKQRADFSGARTEALSMASLRATVEEDRHPRRRNTPRRPGHASRHRQARRDVSRHPAQ
jgi:predicted YcjX-like family ATPase